MKFCSLCISIIFLVPFSLSSSANEPVDGALDKAPKNSIEKNKFLSNNIDKGTRDSFLLRDDFLGHQRNVDNSIKMFDTMRNFGSKVGRYSGQYAPLASYLLSYNLPGGTSGKQLNLLG